MDELIIFDPMGELKELVDEIEELKREKEDGRRN